MRISLLHVIIFFLAASFAAPGASAQKRSHKRTARVHSTKPIAAPPPSTPMPVADIGSPTPGPAVAIPQQSSLTPDMKPVKKVVIVPAPPPPPGPDPTPTAYPKR